MEMLSYRAGCLLTEVMWSHYGLQLEKNMSSKIVFSCEHMAKALTQTARICLYCKWRILKENLAIWATSVLMKLFTHFRDYVCDICANGRLRRVSRIWMQGCADDGSFKPQFHNPLLYSVVANCYQLLGVRFIHRPSILHMCP